MAESARKIVGKCNGGYRHWWTLHGVVGVKAPVCGHCHKPNPFFTDEDAAEYDAVVRFWPGRMTAAEKIEWAKARRKELGWD